MKRNYSISTITALVSLLALITTLGSLIAEAGMLATAGGFIFIISCAVTALAETARTNKRV